MVGSENKKVSVEERVKFLIEEGEKIKCEDTEDVRIENTTKLPEWYDEEKFKRIANGTVLDLVEYVWPVYGITSGFLTMGQKFFHDYIWGMLLAKFCGLILILSIKSILKVLIHTKMSNTALTAYKRYIQTLFHMYVWYDKDFKPGSKLWRSLIEVRNKHNSASKKSCSVGLGGVTQKDMALTQFAFMGFVMVKPRMVGIYSATEEELEGFIHVWRTVGYLLGMEDRFNLCSGTVAETQESCKELVKSVFAPALYNIDKDFVWMVRALVGGLWSFNPAIEYEAFMTFICKLCDISNIGNNNKDTQIIPTSYTPFAILLARQQIYIYQFYIFRVILNYIEYMALWLMGNFPFLAYWHFGYKNSKVRILKNETAY